jgi:hypothetical protein
MAKNTASSSRFERLIRRVVEGQARSFVHDHPEILDTGTTTWKTPSWKTREQQLVDSIAKRIILDLTCADTKAKLIASLAPVTGDNDEGVAGSCTGALAD